MLQGSGIPHRNMFNARHVLHDGPSEVPTLELMLILKLQCLLNECKRVLVVQCHRDVRIVLLPQLDALVDELFLVRTFPLVITFKNHRNQEVENDEVNYEDVGDEVEDVSKCDPTSIWVVDEALVLQNFILVDLVKQIRWRAPRPCSQKVPLVLGEIMHDLVPNLTCHAAEEGHKCPEEVPEVAMVVQAPSVLHPCEELHTKDAVQDQHQQEQEKHVHQSWHREQQRHENLVQTFQEANEPKQACNTEDADDGNHRA
mmetsp:Transcript_26253/g.49532  ORF Transcript_26253/g.49532 Transcript_26253/m.49532 type:complete len:257 (+) Transcript_26253:875-1645(+)